MTTQLIDPAEFTTAVKLLRSFFDSAVIGVGSVPDRKDSRVKLLTRRRTHRGRGKAMRKPHPFRG